jgi:DHA1 family tetracycline resistance protein-like MFS transporter
MSETDKKASRHALAFIFVTVLVDTMGLGIIFPVMPELIEGLTGETTSEASLDSGWLNFSYALAQFICGPIIGNLSDRFGRRPVLLFSLLAFGIDYLVMGFAPTLGWLFVGRIVAGVAGASYTSANACVADLSPPDKRAQNFGLIGAAFGVGFILGPAVGGLLGELGPRAPFFAAAGLALVNLAYGYFLLPETLSLDHRRPFTWRRANTLGTIVSLRRYPTAFRMLAALFLWQLSHWVLPGTWSFYTSLKFGWDSTAIGLSLAFAGLTMIVVQGGLTRVVIPRLGEKRSAEFGIAIAVFALLGYGMATSGWMMYACMVFASLMGLVYPSMNAIMSRQIPASSQGELQGGVASIYSLTSIIGPVVMTQLFGYFTSKSTPIYFPGAAFAFASLLAFLCGIMFLWALRTAAPEMLPAASMTIEPELADAPSPAAQS